ncbi:phage baseplate assembly protein [Magnetospirillum sp. 15-1]|uniref:phage baseplate assembly protein n=1 Tax=Magnetospirillum sp. 15-1 TaxID=1979370 RepID=UPI000BBBBBD8|nr:tyrosine-type recombinase/integrase [Magnetospirillum sp. 15-1]
MADPENRVTLWVDGQQHEGWSTAAVALNLDHIAGDFSLTLTEEYLAGGQLRRQPVRAGQACRLHDLRRTAATRMAELGVPVEHIARVLNHAPRGVTATVYDKHTYVPEKRRALDTWANYLESLVTPQDGESNIVPLRG